MIDWLAPSDMNTTGEKWKDALFSVHPERLYDVMPLTGSSLQGLEKIVCLEPGSPDARELRMGASFGNAGVLPLLFLDAMFSDSGKKPP